MSFEKGEGPIGDEPDPLVNLGGLRRIDNFAESLLGRGLHRAHHETRQKLAGYQAAPSTATAEIDRFVEKCVHGFLSLIVEIFRLIFEAITFFGFLLMGGALVLTYFAPERHRVLYWLTLAVEAYACLAYLYAAASYRRRARQSSEGELGAEDAIRTVRAVLLPAFAIMLAVTGRPLMAAAVFVQACVFFLLTESQTPLRQISPTPPRQTERPARPRFPLWRRRNKHPLNE